MKSLKDEEWLIKEEVVMKKEHIYILEEELREEVVHLYYNMLVGEHKGR